MAVTNGWGKGVINNTNGWGKLATNNISEGAIYENSHSGDTALIGTSAAFFYSAASFTQGDSNPTPTITGTTGGTFSSDAGVVFIDTSTGQINLSASTIASHTIFYIVNGVQASQTIDIQAAPFLNVNSFSFDGIDESVDIGAVTALNVNAFSISVWLNYNFTPTQFTGNFGVLGNCRFPQGNRGWRILQSNKNLQFFMHNTQIQYNVIDGTTVPAFASGQWRHICCTCDGTNTEMFIDGVSVATGAFANPIYDNKTQFRIGMTANGFVDTFFNGKIDEVSIWDTGLSSAAVTEIYNSGTPNNLNSLTNASSSNLKSWIRMGEEATFSNPGGTGNWILVDQSSEGNNGTSQNMEESDRTTDTP